jgi:predicted transcriptional regulator
VQTKISSSLCRSLCTLALSLLALPAGLAQAGEKCDKETTAAIVQNAGAKPVVKVGDAVGPATVCDAENKVATIPDLGKKVLLILYTDPGVADITDKFADRVKELKLPEQYFRSMGVANMADAHGLADFLIRMVVRSKIKKYKVTILTDPALLLKKQWGVGETDDKSVVLVIDKNMKLRYIHRNKNKKDELVGAEQDEAVKIVQQVVAESSDGAYTPKESPTHN